MAWLSKQHTGFCGTCLQAARYANNMEIDCITNHTREQHISMVVQMIIGQSCLSKWLTNWNNGCCATIPQTLKSPIGFPNTPSFAVPGISKIWELCHRKCSKLLEAKIKTGWSNFMEGRIYQHNLTVYKTTTYLYHHLISMDETGQWNLSPRYFIPHTCNGSLATSLCMTNRGAIFGSKVTKESCQKLKCFWTGNKQKFPREIFVSLSLIWTDSATQTMKNNSIVLWRWKPKHILAAEWRAAVWGLEKFLQIAADW